MEHIVNIIGNVPNRAQLIATVIVVIISWLLRRIIHRLLHNYIEEVQVFYRYKKATTYTIFVLATLIMFIVWSRDFFTFTTFLGLVSAGIAIALKDLLASIAAWMFIISRKPFVVGDRIQIGDYSGDVIDSRLFQFTIMEIGNWVEHDQSTGRIVHIPNHKILTDNIANYGAGFAHIWNEIRVVITFESDWDKARTILKEIIDVHAEKHIHQVDEKLKKASKKYLIYYKNLTPIVYLDVLDHGVQLTVRYLCKPKSRRTTVDHIWSDILVRFKAEPDIDLAYPTQRLIVNDTVHLKAHSHDETTGYNDRHI